MEKDERDPLTEKIIGLCLNVHNEAGPAFMERIYHQALITLLEEEKLEYESEKEFDVKFHEKKIGNYLKASSVKTGMLINFENKSCEVKRLSCVIILSNLCNFNI